MSIPHQVVLVDLDARRSATLAERLRMQGYGVRVANDPAEGARLALAEPPSAVIAELWMPSISGVQLCRLLKAQPATESVPVILRGPESGRNRFWAESAGAAAYVPTGRMGDLVRELARAVAGHSEEVGFFTSFPSSGNDIRDQIAQHLDAALFESVITGEVRALGVVGAFDRLFDLFSQFASRIMSYRWLAVSTDMPRRLAVHTNPILRAEAELEARASLGLDFEQPLFAIEDEDAVDAPLLGDPVVARIAIGDLFIGRMAIALSTDADRDSVRFVEVMARELAGPIRMASLVEESQRLATVDALTGLLNRRAFSEAIERELSRALRHAAPVSVVLLDIDHFKRINDDNGHAGGDRVLAEVGRVLADEGRSTDVIARWGGEEFVLCLGDTPLDGAVAFAERVRGAIAACPIESDGDTLRVTASLGVAQFDGAESSAALIDRADRAMYRSKSGGRNRVTADEAPGKLVALG